MDQAVALMAAWARAQPIAGMQLEVVRLPGRTPLIFIEIPGTDAAATTPCCSTAISTSSRR